KVSPNQSNLGGGTCSFNLGQLGEVQIPCFDVFISKLNPNGSALLYSTYLGGSNNEYTRTIAVSSGMISVAGSTVSSADFPTVNPRQGYGGGNNDGFITKIQDAVTKKVRAQTISQ